MHFTASALLFMGLQVLAACSTTTRDDATIAAASDTRDAFREIADIVEGAEGSKIVFVFGSSGLLREQVINGAPYDVYVSANESFVDDVVDAGVGVVDSRVTYAVGRLAIMTAPGVALPSNVRDVTNLGRIVIANPAHAPYGVAAREALVALDVYESVRDRLVYADNVADAVRIVRAGEADAGLVAQSLVGDSPHLAVPTALHAPIRQSLVVTGRGEKNALARRFVEVLLSPEGREILSRYGFMVESP